MTDFNASTSENSPDIFPANCHEDQIPFEVSEYLNFTDDYDESSEVKFLDCSVRAESPHFSEVNSGEPPSAVGKAGTKKFVGGSKKRKGDCSYKVAFRTMSEVEILDDGYRWRKYGKKSVKNSPNPRNYYRCLNAECSVKKRVERDREDSRCVITTYEGMHNHECPSVIYCIAPPTSNNLILGCPLQPHWL